MMIRARSRNPLLGRDRTALRQEAEAANITLDLQACQRVVDHSLKYKPPQPATRHVKKRNW